MLEKYVEDWVLRRAQGHYEDAKLEVAIADLKMFIELEDDVLTLDKILQEMADANDAKKPLCMKNFTDVERFMKKLCKIVYPDLLDTKPEPLFPTDRRTKWMLANMYKQAFEVVSMDVNLSAPTEEDLNCRQGYRMHYVRIYKFRNEFVHEEPTKEQLGNDNIESMITSMIVIYLDLCNRYHKALERLVQAKQRRSVFDDKAFCEDILKAYEEQIAAGFGYLDVHWVNLGSSDRNEYTMDVLASKEEMRLVKLLGEAGTGKSTALRRLEYAMAKRRLENPLAPIPIYIELCDLKNVEQVILEKVATIMEISTEIALQFMTTGEVCLLLDGFNEMLDGEVQRSFARELDSTWHNFRQMRIFLSDRSEARDAVLTMMEAEKLYLVEIDLEDKRNYFHLNTKDEELIALIDKQIDENPLYFGELRTPLMLKELLDVVTEERIFPADVLDHFVKTLLIREKKGKRDPNVDYVTMYLQVLALMEMEEYPRLRALNQMAKYRTALGFSNSDTVQCLKLALDMGLLVEENERIRFAKQSYKSYFLVLAYENGMDEVELW